MSENVCMEDIHTSLSLYITMYTHYQNKTRDIGIRLILRSLPSGRVQWKPCLLFLHLRIDSSLKSGSDIQPP